MTGRSTDSQLLQRIRDWCEPENNQIGKRACKYSLEITVGRTHTCDKGMRRPTCKDLIVVGQLEWYRGILRLFLETGVFFIDSEGENKDEF